MKAWLALAVGILLAIVGVWALASTVPADWTPYVNALYVLVIVASGLSALYIKRRADRRRKDHTGHAR